MLKFLYKHRLLLLCLAIPYFFILLFVFVKVDYSITTPANVSKIEDIILIENGSKSNGSINVTSVYSYDKVSLLQYLIASCNDYAEISPLVDYANISYNDIVIGGTILKETSIYNAIIAGYKAAGYDLNYKFDGYYVVNTFKFSDESIHVGDKILSVEDQTLNENLTFEAACYLKLNEFSKQYNGNFDLVCENIDSLKINLTVLRYKTDTPTKITISPKVYIEGASKFITMGVNTDVCYIPENDDNSPDFNILWNNVNSIGSSGGLLQAFYVYESLTGCKLSNNLSIAGTGEIDKDGNVGLISGIKQKIVTAEFSDVDIFIVPVTSENYMNDPNEVNYIEAMQGYNSLKDPDIVLIPAWSLESLIEGISNYLGGAH